MSYAPQTLLDVRAYLISQTGLSPEAVGIVGNPKTHTYGYHLGRDRLPANDYSNRLPRDRNGLTNAASALDVGWFDRLPYLTSFLLDRCRDGSTNLIRAIQGPHFSGRAYRWDSTKGWEPEILKVGDDHERHTHIEWFRDTEFVEKVSLFRAFFGSEGGDEMEVIRKIQQGLLEAGFDPGGIDGEWGPRTMAAFVAAMRAAGPAGPQGPPGPPGSLTGAKVTLVGEITQAS